MIAESFADIFYNNCSKNGVLPVVLTTGEVQKIHENIAAEKAYQITVDLENNQVTDGKGFEASFTIDDFRRQCFLEGLDHIALTMKHEEKITQYEQEKLGLA